MFPRLCVQIETCAVNNNRDTTETTTNDKRELSETSEQKQKAEEENETPHHTTECVCVWADTHGPDPNHQFPMATTKIQTPAGSKP